MVDLRIHVERAVRVCPACGGSGRFVRSGRPCRLCHQARLAIDATNQLLLPFSEAEITSRDS
jgi:DnaJ-class molecular chaperone